ncbi:MAG: hypothetical protein JXB47_02475 [Anaerolineae bacterium]|nr:hypothetical protein [Anaerolineae bacterium]
MEALSLKEQIIEELKSLSPVQQAQVLAFARRLHKPTPEGMPGEVWLAKMDTFEFEPGALDEMMRAIEEDCERIDWDGWDLSL